MERQRLFIAVDVSGDVIQRCRSIIQDLQRKNPTTRANWVDPNNLHLTLRFLGSTRVDDVPAVQSVVERVAARHRSFPISFWGLGAFPANAAPQVIWAAVREGEGALARIAAELDQELGKLGFEKERRAFAAHLTLARIKDRKFQRGSLATFRETELGSSVISELVLFESQTLPTGAVYRTISRARLA